MNTLIAITGLGVLCLLLEILNLRKAIVPITIVGLLAILGLDISEYSQPQSYYTNMVVVSPFSTAFSGLFIVFKS
jgi:NADH-quinone oxidoreductase subunit N